VGHAVKLCGPCGSAQEGDSTHGCHAAPERNTLTPSWAATDGAVEFLPMGHAVKLHSAPSCGCAFEGDSTPGCHTTSLVGDSTPGSAATLGKMEWPESTGWDTRRRTPAQFQRSSAVSAVTNMNSEQRRAPICVCDVCQRPAREGEGGRGEGTKEGH
jgi:hypothetical protein